MFYIIYKTTNIVNQKFYIGKHKCKKLSFDGYLGSGKLLKEAIKKYGKASFIREILFVFDTEAAASLKEAEIISKEFLFEHLETCYNLHVGGTGGRGYISQDDFGNYTFNENTTSEKQKKIISERMKNTAVYEYEDGTRIRLSKNHPDVLSNEVTAYKTKSSIYIMNGEKVRLSRDDPRVLSGDAIHIFNGIKLGNGGFSNEKSLFISEDGESIVLIDKEQAMNRGLTGMNLGTSVYVYPNGERRRLSVDHTDVVSGLAKSINLGRKMQSYECPHCSKVGAGNNMKRYHFDNCKFNLLKE